jgi:Xaa-Pro aminopeptidase
VSSAATGYADRLRAIGGELAERGLDALLVASKYDVRYVTGFTGDEGEGAAIVVADPGGRLSDSEDGGRGSGGGGGGGGVAHGRPRNLFLTDFRYTTQSEQEVAGEFDREIVTGELIDAVAARLAEGGGRLGFDEAATTVAAHARLADRLPGGWELVPSAGIVRQLRLVKDEQEVARIRAAARLADEAIAGLLEDGLRGRPERAVAIDLELRMRRLGAEAPSFATIVASGPHGALPHAQPRADEIPADVLVTIDWGAVLDGYCSDCTRTYATGEGISARAREVYELVRSAQQAGLDAVRAGPSGREVDAAAREVIEMAGEGERFGHGLGHGVGLEVHEGPRLSRTAGEQPLQAGNVVTVEPGVYIPGELGVRIEDLVVVRDEGPDVLTSLPKELTVVG